MSESKTRCPYFRRVDESFQYPILGYCEGSSVCALRVVSVGEFKRFCSTGDYGLCPIYRCGLEARNTPHAS
jgi:hypothetical protein